MELCMSYLCQLLSTFGETRGASPLGPQPPTDYMKLSKDEKQAEFYKEKRGRNLHAHKN
jgi:hypothetical protein